MVEKWKKELYPRTYNFGKESERIECKGAGDYFIYFHPNKVGLALFKFIDKTTYFCGEVS